jgi:hypothetical protein
MADVDILDRLWDIALLRGDMAGQVIPIACKDAADVIIHLRTALGFAAGLLSNTEQYKHMSQQKIYEALLNDPSVVGGNEIWPGDVYE